MSATELGILTLFILLMIGIAIAGYVEDRLDRQRDLETMAKFHAGAHDAKSACDYCSQEKGTGATCVGCGAPTRPKQYGPYGVPPKRGRRRLP